MIPVDAFDLKMLAALQDDGRLTNQQLADQVGLSASQCSRRRMRLEEEKVIAGYHADLAGEALGFNLIAFIHITLATHSPDNAKKFRALVNRVDEIQEAYSLTGDADYLLKAVLRDLKSLSDIVNNVLMPRDRHGAATPAELRILRQGPAAERDGGADLFLRMHVLCGLRREQIAQRLPELRRRFCSPADPAHDPDAAWRLRRQAAAVRQARASEVQPRGCGCAFGAAAGYSAGTAVKKTSSFRGDATHRTRNLEIPGLVLTHHPGMTAPAHPAGVIVPSTSPNPTR